MIIFLILLILLIVWLRRSPKRTKSIEMQAPATLPQEETAVPVNNNDYSQAYQRKYIFTRNEKSEYRKLAAWAQQHGFDVFPKMRLADIIEPRSGDNYMSLFGKIRAKHLDFVICDQECRIKFIIELDDNSHNQLKRMERDDFVTEACRGAGYTVIHTKGISEEFLNNILNQEKDPMK